MLCNHRMLSTEDNGLALSEYDFLSLHHRLRQALTRAEVPHCIVHRIPDGREVLEQHQRIGVLSHCTQVLHLFSTLFLRHIVIIVLQEFVVGIRFVARLFARELPKYFAGN